MPWDEFIDYMEDGDEGALHEARLEAGLVRWGCFWHLEN